MGLDAARLTPSGTRRELGMSQAELARAVGCRRETIGNLEIGRYNPSLRLAYDISVALDASIYDLFHFEGDPAEKTSSITIEKGQQCSKS